MHKVNVDTGIRVKRTVENPAAKEGDAAATSTVESHHPHDSDVELQPTDRVELAVGRHYVPGSVESTETSVADAVSRGWVVPVETKMPPSPIGKPHSGGTMPPVPVDTKE